MLCFLPGKPGTRQDGGRPHGPQPTTLHSAGTEGRAPGAQQVQVAAAAGAGRAAVLSEVGAAAGAGGAAPPSLAQPGAPRHAAGLFWRPSTPGQRPGGGAAAVSRAENADAAEMLLLEGKDGQVWC